MGAMTLVSASFAGSASAATPTCTATGFVRDGINLTAALINPGRVGGEVNATDCNIGVYFGTGTTGQVTNADVYGANYYGIVNDGGNVKISNSNVHNIGDVPFDGDQHGVGIYFNYDSGATGSISNNIVSNYQKGGIVVNGGNDSASITNNTVTGLGPVNFIAQNGIQIGYGASGSIVNNNVTGNAYTGANDASSAGILVYGGCGDPQVTNLQVQNNNLVNNDIGIYMGNYDATCTTPSPVPTSNQISNNLIVDNAITNISGNDNGTLVQGYQAGILDIGDGDVISNNTILGVGYTPAITTGPTYVIAIDTSFTTNAQLRNNNIGGIFKSGIGSGFNFGFGFGFGSLLGGFGLVGPQQSGSGSGHYNHG
jgi:hypothetical protein